MTTVVPAAVRGQSTSLTSLASQNAAPSVTTGSRGGEVGAEAAWTSGLVVVASDTAAPDPVVRASWALSPPVDVRLGSAGYTTSNADVVDGTGGTTTT